MLIPECPMLLVDTHCHLNHPQFDTDGAAVLARAQAAGVARFLVIGYDLASSLRAVEMTDTAGLFAAIGIHPESAGEWNDETALILTDLWRSHPAKIGAYGEIGLDYHWETIPRAEQHHAFSEQIAFARTFSSTLPLIIHSRDSQPDILAVLRESETPAPIVMHCFTGDTEAARPILDAGYYLGIGGVATFKKSEDLREAIAAAPLDRLLLETDCPYLAPQPWRGRRNEPSYLPAVVQTVATIKNISVETVAEVTSATARSLFGFS